jgi:DNA-binding MarR family transcriptional regulator
VVSGPEALPLGARPDLDARLVAAVERAGHALRVQLRERARRHRLSVVQAQVLQRLACDGPARRRVGALAEELDVTHPTMSDALNALHARGLVVRTRGRDRRTRTLALSARGRLVAQDLGDWSDAAGAVLARLPRRDKERALETLLRLIAELQRDGVITIARTCVSCRFFRPAPPGSEAPHRCALLDADLADGDLRVDCPDHQAAA